MLGDQFLHPSLADISIPLVSGYKTLWTTLGIVAGWGLVLLGVSYYARRRIGAARWRKLHRFTALAWVSCHFRADWGGKAGLALLMTLSVSAALEALHLARGHVADLAGIAVAAATVWYGYGLRFIPIAVLLGCATHITGDMLTDSGCMLGYPWSRYRFHLLPEPLAFTTGTLPELLIIDPILSAAVLALAAWIVDPAWLHAQWGA